MSQVLIVCVHASFWGKIGLRVGEKQGKYKKKQDKSGTNVGQKRGKNGARVRQKRVKSRAKAGQKWGKILS